MHSALKLGQALLPVVLVAVVVVEQPACSSHDACVENRDCGPAQACAFRVQDGCGAKGRCLDLLDRCPVESLACGCDGQPIKILCNVGPDYVSAPVRDMSDRRCAYGDAGVPRDAPLE